MTNESFADNPVWDKILNEKVREMWGDEWKAKVGGGLRGLARVGGGVGELVASDGALKWWVCNKPEVRRGGGGYEKKVSVLAITTRKSSGGFIEDFNGQPGSLYVRTDGSIFERTFYKAGRKCDPQPDVASVTYFHKNGVAGIVVHYDNDAMTDSASGLPAKLLFNDKGELISGAMSDGKCVQVFTIWTPRELLTRIRDVTKARVSRICDGEDAAPSIMAKSGGKQPSSRSGHIGL